MTATQWTAEARRYEALSDAALAEGSTQGDATAAAYNAAAVIARVNAYSADDLQELASSLAR